MSLKYGSFTRTVTIRLCLAVRKDIKANLPVRKENSVPRTTEILQTYQSFRLLLYPTSSTPTPGGEPYHNGEDAGRKLSAIGCTHHTYPKNLPRSRKVTNSESLR